MIEIKNLEIKVWEKNILKDVSLTFEAGKNYLVLGKNGSGKSSLSSFLMGNPAFEYVSGEVEMDGKNLLEISSDERSKAGLFLSFQNVPEIEGINLRDYLRTIYNAMLKNRFPETPALTPFVFKRFIKKHLEELSIPENFLDRDLNVGFSWWEKRKIEMLQAKLLGPKYIILDEIDSGLDLDAFKLVAQLIASLDSVNNSIIVITHHFKIAEHTKFDTVYVLKNGELERQWGMEMIDEIMKNGFGE